ncbi:hypothetical protein QQX98_000046 [Neonectria punicea]|uniref:Uncharacterized protein n=1 Tax=Neonectria punicea TaxID=979145 RepID=A0ABR1HWC3_9HYPO
MEHELRAVIHYGTELHQYERLAMPLLNSHEPEFFWLLSEIALRQIYMNALCGVGRTTRVAYAPRVARELISQLDQWYEHLHPTVKFPLGPELVLDTQKAFLRAQYYAARFQVNWSYVVQLLSMADLDIVLMNRPSCLKVLSVPLSMLYWSSARPRVFARKGI